ncbi:MAG: GntR family transcriptional regulator [Pseudomonadota bacterium]
MTGGVNDVLTPENWSNQHGGPLYAQFSRHIETIIRSGRLQAGTPLPSERDLAKISKLSRVTVRKAVQQLVRDGLIVQRQGSGTSVAPAASRVQQSLSRLTSFSEDMQRRGLKAESRWLERGIFAPSPEETMALGLTADEDVARVSRLRIADGRPLAIERASLSTQTLPDPENIEGSLYAHLAKTKMQPSRAIQRLSADILSGENAALLDVPEGSAGLRIQRISYLDSGQIVEFTRSVYRGDAYDFVAELQISNNG